MKDSDALSVAPYPLRILINRRLMIGLCLTAAFFYWLSLYLYVPTLPNYVESKIADLAVVGTILSMYGLMQALVRLPLGIAADWLGRRKIFVILGLFLSGLGAWLLGTTGSWQGLLVGRSITGLGASTWGPLLVIFSGFFPAADAVRASSLLTLTASFGRLFGTSLTGSLNESGGYVLAFFLAAAAAGVGILIVWPIRDIPHPPQRRSPTDILKLIVRKDVLVPALMNAVLQYAIYASTYGFLPILAQQRGATEVTQSQLVSFQIVIVIFGNLIATAVAKRLGNLRLVYFTLALICLGLLIAAFTGSLPILFAAQFCLGMAYGLGYPVLMGMSIQQVEDGQRTIAMGLHQSVYSVGMFGGPWASGILANAIGLQPMFGVTAIACLLSGGFLIHRLRLK